MAKQKTGSTEAGKPEGVGQKLGCRLSSDASAILGALEYTLRSGTGDVVVRALVSLVDSLPRKQAEAVEAMVRIHGASLSRLRKSCGATVAESVPPESVGQQGGGAAPAPGVVDSSATVPALMARTSTISAMFKRSHAPIDEALDVIGGGN